MGRKKKIFFFPPLFFFLLIFILEWSFIVGHLFLIQKAPQAAATSLSLSLSLFLSLLYFGFPNLLSFISYDSLVPFFFFFCKFSLCKKKTKEKAMCFYY